MGLHSIYMSVCVYMHRPWREREISPVKYPDETVHPDVRMVMGSQLIHRRGIAMPALGSAAPASRGAPSDSPIAAAPSLPACKP